MLHGKQVDLKIKGWQLSGTISDYDDNDKDLDNNGDVAAVVVAAAAVATVVAAVVAAVVVEVVVMMMMMHDARFLAVAVGKQVKRTHKGWYNFFHREGSQAFFISHHKKLQHSICEWVRWHTFIHAKARCRGINLCNIHCKNRAQMQDWCNGNSKAMGNAIKAMWTSSMSRQWHCTDITMSAQQLPQNHTWHISMTACSCTPSSEDWIPVNNCCTFPPANWKYSLATNNNKWRGPCNKGVNMEEEWEEEEEEDGGGGIGDGDNDDGCDW